jgi:hypothetical protein
MPDRAEIVERIYRYGWGYDERDRELLSDCFIEEAVWEGNLMGTTPMGPFNGRDAIVAFLMEFWEVQVDQRRHIFTNVILQDLTATEATAHGYLLLTAAGDETMTPVTTGPYRFELVRQDDSWRIRRLVAGFDAPI